MVLIKEGEYYWVKWKDVNDETHLDVVQFRNREFYHTDFDYLGLRSISEIISHIERPIKQ